MLKLCKKKKLVVKDILTKNEYLLFDRHTQRTLNTHLFNLIMFRNLFIKRFDKNILDSF